MTIFAILLPLPQPNLAAAIKRAYPLDHLMITETQWLISSTGTVIEVTAKLGIYDKERSNNPPTGSAIVFAISSYFGRAPTPVWDWIRSKLEARPNA